MATTVTPDVVGTAGAAEMCGVEVQRISRWKSKGKMPDPAADTASGPVYWRTDIEALAKGEDPHTFGSGLGTLRVLSLGDAQVFLGELLEKPKLSKTQIGRWREAGEFPEPWFYLPAGQTEYPMWNAADVATFAGEARGRAVSQRAEKEAWRAVRKALEEKRNRGRNGAAE